MISLRKDLAQKLNDQTWIPTHQGDEGQIQYYLEFFKDKASDKHAGNLYAAISSLIPRELGWKTLNLNLGDVISLREDLTQKLNDQTWITAHQGDEGQIQYYLEFFKDKSSDKHAGNLYSAISSLIQGEAKKLLKWTRIDKPMSELVPQGARLADAPKKNDGKPLSEEERRKKEEEEREKIKAYAPLYIDNLMLGSRKRPGLTFFEIGQRVAANDLVKITKEMVIAFIEYKYKNRPQEKADSLADFEKGMNSLKPEPPPPSVPEVLSEQKSDAVVSPEKAPESTEEAPHAMQPPTSSELALADAVSISTILQESGAWKLVHGRLPVWKGVLDENFVSDNALLCAKYLVDFVEKILDAEPHLFDQPFSYERFTQFVTSEGEYLSRHKAWTMVLLGAHPIISLWESEMIRNEAGHIVDLLVKRVKNEIDGARLAYRFDETILPGQLHFYGAPKAEDRTKLTIAVGRPENIVLNIFPAGDRLLVIDITGDTDRGVLMRPGSKARFPGVFFYRDMAGSLRIRNEGEELIYVKTADHFIGGGARLAVSKLKISNGKIIHAPENVDWIFDRILTRDELESRPAVRIEMDPKKIPAFQLNEEDLHSAPNISQKKQSADVYVTKVPGLEYPAAIKIFGIKISPENRQKELVKAQVLDRLGLARFYGVVLGDAKTIIGYAMGVVAGKDYEPDVRSSSDEHQIFINDLDIIMDRLYSAGLLMGDGIMETRKGLPVLIDAMAFPVRDESVFRDFIKKNNLAATRGLSLAHDKKSGARLSDEKMNQQSNIRQKMDRLHAVLDWVGSHYMRKDDRTARKMLDWQRDHYKALRKRWAEIYSQSNGLSGTQPDLGQMELDLNQLESDISDYTERLIQSRKFEGARLADSPTKFGNPLSFPADVVQLADEINKKVQTHSKGKFPSKEAIEVPFKQGQFVWLVEKMENAYPGIFQMVERSGKKYIINQYQGAEPILVPFEQAKTALVPVVNLQKEAIEMLDRSKGWKIHLNFDANDGEVVREIQFLLTTLLSAGVIRTFKIGEGGGAKYGQPGKEATVYLGYGHTVKFVADYLEKVNAEYLTTRGKALLREPSYGARKNMDDVLATDLLVTKFIAARFDVAAQEGKLSGADNDFHAYGPAGFPNLVGKNLKLILSGLSGVKRAESFEDLNALSHKILAERYGEFYTDGFKGMIDGRLEKGARLAPEFSTRLAEMAATLGARLTEKNNSPFKDGAQIATLRFEKLDVGVMVDSGASQKLFIHRSAIKKSAARLAHQKSEVVRAVNESRALFNQTANGPVQTVDIVADDLFGPHALQVEELVESAREKLKAKNVRVRFITQNFELDKRYEYLSDVASADEGSAPILLASKRSVLQMTLPENYGLLLIDQKDGEIAPTLPSIATAADLKRYGAIESVAQRLETLTGKRAEELADKISFLKQIPKDFNENKESYLEKFYEPALVQTLKLSVPQLLSYLQMSLKFVGSAA